VRTLEAHARDVDRLAELRMIEGFEERQEIRSVGGGEWSGCQEAKGDGERDSRCVTAPADDHSGILVPADRPATIQFFGISVPQ